VLLAAFAQQCLNVSHVGLLDWSSMAGLCMTHTVLTLSCKFRRRLLWLCAGNASAAQQTLQHDLDPPAWKLLTAKHFAGSGTRAAQVCDVMLCGDVSQPYFI
jgi:hypothetical protein